MPRRRELTIQGVAAALGLVAPTTLLVQVYLHERVWKYSGTWLAVHRVARGLWPFYVFFIGHPPLSRAPVSGLVLTALTILANVGLYYFVGRLIARLIRHRTPR
jgi:hypothetical protein